MSLAVAGITVPTVNNSNSILKKFPNVNRRYKVRSGITARYYHDYLPFSVNSSNGCVSEKYNEFILNSNQQEFSYFKSFALELKLLITKSNGSILDAGSNLTLTYGAKHRML